MTDPLLKAQFVQSLLSHVTMSLLLIDQKGATFCCGRTTADAEVRLSLAKQMVIVCQKQIAMVGPKVLCEIYKQAAQGNE